jgi:heme-degrading monooxygenase HmoA
MHVIIWEFTVPEVHRAAFEQAYGPDGDWALLFRTARGYCGTELLRDDAMAGRYMTIDRWERPEDFARFKQMSAAAYEALDRKFETITAGEAKIGAFDVPDTAR